MYSNVLVGVLVKRITISLVGEFNYVGDGLAKMKRVWAPVGLQLMKLNVLLCCFKPWRVSGNSPKSIDHGAG